MRSKLAVISQTETLRDRFFVGDPNEFFDEEGNASQVRIMRRLDELEKVIVRRLERLDTRQNGDWLTDLERKIAQAVSLIDSITA